MATAVASRQAVTSPYISMAHTAAPAFTARRPAHLRPVPAPAVSDLAAELDRIGSTGTYASEHTVIGEGDPAQHVLKVTSGTLRVVRLLSDGRRHIVQFLAAGDFFGLTETEEYAESVETVTEATIVRYSRRSFDAFLAQNPRAGQWLYNLMCKNLSAAHAQSLLLGRKNALERMASFLAEEADRQSANAATGDRREVALPMTRLDIADYLGLTIETVSRILGKLKACRIIGVPDTHVILLRNLTALRLIAGGEAMAGLA